MINETNETNGTYTHNNAYILDRDMPLVFGSIDEDRLKNDLDIPAMAKEDAENASVLNKTPSSVPAKIMQAAESLQRTVVNTYNLKIDNADKQIKVVRRNYDGLRGRLKKICSDRAAECAAELASVNEKIKIAKAREAEEGEYLTRFKEENGLTDRSADRITGSDLFFRWTVIIFFLTAETGFNAVLFGGAFLFAISKAFVPSFLNMCFGLLAGACYRHLHVKKLRKRAFVCLGMLCLTIFGLNLGISHYRTAMINLEPVKERLDVLENMENPSDAEKREALSLKAELSPGKAAWEIFKNDPFRFTDIEFLFIFIFGLICSFADAFEFYKTDDPYPGFRKRTVAFENVQEKRLLSQKEYDETVKKYSHAVREDIKGAQNELMNDIAELRSMNDTYLSYKEDFPRFGKEMSDFFKDLLIRYCAEFAKNTPDRVPVFDVDILKGIKGKKLKSLSEEPDVLLSKIEEDDVSGRLADLFAEAEALSDETMGKLRAEKVL